MAPAAFSQTCSTAAWGQGGNPNVLPVVGSPVAGQPGTVRRYEGRCGLRAPTGGSHYVQDSSPAAEPTFRARFYAFLPNTGSASTIFRAGNAADALTDYNTGRIRVVWNGSNSINALGPGGTPSLTCSGLTPGRWYSIELAYNSTASPLGSGSDTLAANSMRMIVRNEALSPVVNCSQTGPGVLTNANNTIDYVQLGNLTGGPAGNAITVDSYESRRTTPIGRLCRGDANGDGNRSSGDITAIQLEFLGGGVPVGQTAQPGSKPDCNEDGIISSGDITCVSLIFLGGAGACPPAI
jgi:hypothetical protein